MAALFGNAGDNSRREPRSLLEFRAGKMKLSGTTVSADTRKGLVYVKMEDGLLHFCWKDRKNGEIVDDFIIFPGDAELKRVSQCTTGRVLLLKFKDTSRKFFYWLQEPKDDKDEEYLKKVNELIEHPPDPAQVEAIISGQGFPPAGLGGLPLQNLLGGAANNPQLLEQLINSGALPAPGMMALDALSGRGLSSAQQQLASSLGGRSQQQSSSSPSPAPNPSSSSTSAPPQSNQSQQQQQSSQQSGHQVQLGDLQNILSAMNIPTAPQSQESVREEFGLTDVVTPDILRPLSSDQSVQEQLEPHIPQTSDSVTDVLTSPQFQQALGVFGSALQSGQLGPLMSQFGMGQEVVHAANTGSLQQFASALQGERDQTGATELNQDSQSGDKGENEGGEPTSKENKSDKEDQGTA